MEIHRPSNMNVTAPSVANMNDATKPIRPGTISNGNADSSRNNKQSNGDNTKSIDFSNLHFIGRQDERRQLTEAYANVVRRSASEDAPNKHGAMPAVMVWGQSGTGKSCLIKQFVDDVSSPLASPRTATANMAAAASSTQPQPQLQALQTPRSSGPCYFIQGKHDEHTGASDPFSAITQALKGLSDLLRSEPEKEVSRVRHCVKEALGDEATAVVSMVPALSILFQDSSGESHLGQSTAGLSSSSAESSSASEEVQAVAAALERNNVTNVSWKRLQYTFVTFIRALATSERPLVLFLDDLQWASRVTTELLSTLLADPGLKYFFFIGAIRQDANPHGEDADAVLPLPHDAPVSVMLDGLRDKHRRLMLDVHLSNLNPSQLTAWISTILQEKDGDAEAQQSIAKLSRRLHSRTHGNVYFTIQALEQMYRAKMIFYDHKRSHWNWKWPQSAHAARHQSSDASHGYTVSTAANTSTHDDDFDGGATFELSNNIIDIIANKLRLLPPRIRTALTLASYIRSNFDLDVLQAVMDSELRHGDYAKMNDLVFHDDTSENSRPTPSANSVDQDGEAAKSASVHNSSLESLLEKAVLEGLLNNTIGGTTYRFAHDRIKEAAQSLIPLSIDRATKKHGSTRTRSAKNFATPTVKARHSEPTGTRLNNRQRLKYRIGRCLWKYCQEKENTDDLDDHGLMFVAADHLNSVPSKTFAFMASVNLEVGKKALSLAAVMSASNYLDQADAALRSHQRKSSTSGGMWKENYELALELYRYRIDAKLALGNYEVGYKLSEVLMENARNVEDKLHTFSSMASAMGAQHRDADSLKLSMQGAQQLGIYPKKWFLLHAISGMISLRRFFRTHTDEDVLELPASTDSKVLGGMRSITHIVIRSFLQKDILTMIVAVCKLMQLSIRHGVADATAFAIASYGVICAFQHEQQAAMRCVGLSRRLLSRFNDKRLYGWTNFYNVFFVEIWCCPVEHSLSRLKEAYTTSLEVGEFEVATLCWFASLTTTYFDSKLLQPLMKIGEDLLNHKVMFNVDTLGSFPGEFVVTIKRMAGVLPLDWKEAQEFSETDIAKADRYNLIGGAWSRLNLAVYFLKHELTEKLWTILIKVGVDDAYTMLTPMIFAGGIMAAGRYRQTKKKKYRKMLKECRSKLKTMAFQSGPNCLHRSLILQAEETSFKSKKRSQTAIMNQYDTAIAVSKKGDHMQESALCCELAGDYLLSTKKAANRALSMSYFTHAYELYNDWGGMAKVKDLEARRGGCIKKTVIAEKRKEHADRLHKANNMVEGNDTENIVSLPLTSGGSLSLDGPSTFGGAGLGQGVISLAMETRETHSKMESASKTTSGSGTNLGSSVESKGMMSGGGHNETDDDVSILTTDSQEE